MSSPQQETSPALSASSIKPRKFFLERPFLLLWFGQLAFYISFIATMSAMPVYASQLGASSFQVGLVSGLFSVGAMLGRLYVGRYADRGHKIKLLAVGAAGFLLVAVFYALLGPIRVAFAIPAVTLVLLLRLPYGLCMATTTAGQALVIDLSPTTRRGEALSLLGLTPTLSTALFPGIGMAIAMTAGYPALFWFCAAAALAALLLVIPNREPVFQPEDRPSARLFSSRVLLPGLVLFCLQFPFGSVVSFLPVYALERGMANPGLFFLAYSATMFATQSFMGRLSDRHGRLVTILPGLFLVSLGIAAVSVSKGSGFLIAGVLYGAGMGAAQQILFAWAGDLVPPAERGSAIATMGLFLDGGITTASFATGLAAGLISLQATFLAVSIVPLVGIAITLYANRRITRQAS